MQRRTFPAGWMKTSVVLIGMAWSACAQTPAWDISPDADKGTLTISHGALGVVLKDVRLNVRTAAGLVPATGWTVQGGNGRWTIRASAPRSGWRIEASEQILSVSATATDSVVTATVPGSAERMVVRLVDPQGTPVEWKGTDEVKNGYGGTETINRSYLPRLNSEVSYFSLGQVAGPQFHAIFDRKTDTAIDFGPDARLKRNASDGNLLDLTLPVHGSTTIRAAPEYFAKTLGVPYYVPFDDSVFGRAPMVWSSWTSYYEAVNEQDIIRNAEWLSVNLRQYGFEYVQLDDGYDRGSRGEHYWIENWDKEKFPHGPQWLTEQIRSKGLKAGLWIVPNAYAGALESHPDWYLRDRKGGLILDYRTPSLDSSNPEVMAFVRRMFETLDSWGFDYYKFDGEHELPRYVPAVDRHRLHDPNSDLLADYRRRLEAIREVLGPKRFIEGCPAGTPLNGIGYFNSYFTGQDLYNTWLGMYPLFSSINANAFLNHIVAYVMPGEGLELGLPLPVEEAAKIRPKVVIDTARTRESPLTTFGLTDAEARTLVTYVALTGVAYPLASVMPELPEQRVRMLKATMPTMPILPVDLFSRGTDMLWNTFQKESPDFYVHHYPEILDLKVNGPAGIYDIVALTNWRGARLSRSIDLGEKLGVDPDAAYVAFDFWNQKPLGVMKDRLVLDVEPHDTRVVLIRPLLDRPQLIGISRHISGAYSVLQQSWEAGPRRLRGAAETIAGEPYAIWIHVPERYRVARVRAVLKDATEIPVEQETAAGALMIRFAGQGRPVDWEVQFGGG
jgi:hypothetical protein